MSLERDPELGRLLESAVGPAEARPEARARIQQNLAERLPRARGGSWHWAWAAAALVACVVGARFAERVLTRPATHALDLSAPISWVPLQNARVALLGASRLQVEREDARETVVRLLAGTALFHVQKGAGRHFVVEAGRRRVEVVTALPAFTAAPSSSKGPAGCVSFCQASSDETPWNPRRSGLARRRPRSCRWDVLGL